MENESYLICIWLSIGLMPHAWLNQVRIRYDFRYEMRFTSGMNEVRIRYHLRSAEIHQNYMAFACPDA